MRTGRLIGKGVQFYHCMSRILERRYFIGQAEKEYFMDILRRLERFTGVKVLTYCLMDNHFHLLLKVGKKPDSISERELLDRVKALYGTDKAAFIKQTFAQIRKDGSKKWMEQEKQIYLDRMYDLSVFMKELKQRFTQWYNKRKDRRGPLWEDRFKSVMVEGTHQAMATLAAYIDLNPVRAGICDDPKDYRWCGYGEALGGNTKAQAGLQTVMSFSRPTQKWGPVQKRYRVLLFGVGRGHSVRKGFDREKVLEVLQAKGTLSPFELLRCRVRYFSDGLAFGSRRFIESIFQEHRDRFSERRKEGSRTMQGMDWGELATMQNLRKETIFLSG